MNTVKVADGSFVQARSFGMAGENILRGPASFEWDRTPGTAKVKVFTDSKLAEAADDKSERKVALLIESPAVRRGVYERMVAMAPWFDAVLTFKRDLVQRGAPFLFYPLGGSWIPSYKWGIQRKSKNVSILASPKIGQQGHKLRHEVATLDGIDTFGQDYGGYIESKADALRDYRYSVIIENTREDYYFTEKLIDCLSQGTIPLYWGCPSLGDFFDMDGVIPWTTIDQLRYELRHHVSPQDYEQRLPAVRANLERAKQYRCPEDWIWHRYPGLLA